MTVSVIAFSSRFSSAEILATSSSVDSITSLARTANQPARRITLSTTNHSDTPLYQQANKVMTVALKKLGYKLKIRTLPNKRSLLWANSGITDGDLFRVSTLDLKQLPNLQQVTEPLFTIDQSVLSKKDFNVVGWDSMKNYSIAYERGTKFIEEKEDKFKHVYLVNRTEQAIAMVFNDRADVTITSFSTATKFLNKNKEHAETIKILQPPLVSITLHVYLNHKLHKKLAKALSEVLKDMKSSGQFQQLLEGNKSNESNYAKTKNPTDK